MNGCPHWQVEEIGHESSGETIYRCVQCGEIWNGGAE